MQRIPWKRKELQFLYPKSKMNCIMISNMTEKMRIWTKSTTVKTTILIKITDLKLYQLQVKVMWGRPISWKVCRAINHQQNSIKATGAKTMEDTMTAKSSTWTTKVQVNSLIQVSKIKILRCQNKLWMLHSSILSIPKTIIKHHKVVIRNFKINNLMDKISNMTKLVLHGLTISIIQMAHSKFKTNSNNIFLKKHILQMDSIQIKIHYNHNYNKKINNLKVGFKEIIKIVLTWTLWCHLISQALTPI